MKVSFSTVLERWHYHMYIKGSIWKHVARTCAFKYQCTSALAFTKVWPQKSFHFKAPFRYWLWEQTFPLAILKPHRHDFLRVVLRAPAFFWATSLEQFLNVHFAIIAMWQTAESPRFWGAIKNNATQTHVVYFAAIWNYSDSVSDSKSPNVNGA